jgi:Rrf2 family protein
VRISHRVDYGVRAIVAIAEIQRDEDERAATRAELAAREEIPVGFLTDILAQLRTADLLRSRRGGTGGWTLARPASSIRVADVIRALEGPLASVRGIRPHELGEEGGREPFVSMWVAVRASLRSVLEAVTIADLADGTLPDPVARFAADPDAWDAHGADGSRRPD